jgi:hypothetical protein
VSNNKGEITIYQEETKKYTTTKRNQGISMATKIQKWCKLHQKNHHLRCRVLCKIYQHQSQQMLNFSNKYNTPHSHGEEKIVKWGGGGGGGGGGGFRNPRHTNPKMSFESQSLTNSIPSTKAHAANIKDFIMHSIITVSTSCGMVAIGSIQSTDCQP